MLCASPLTLNGLDIPCGRCLACKLSYAKEWTTRQVMEKYYWDKMGFQTYFATFTYSDESDYIQSQNLAFAKRCSMWNVKDLPIIHSLNTLDARNLVRRIRGTFGSWFRYVLVGEYGEDTFRPHYHATLYGINIPDLVHFCNTDHGELFTSALMESVWPYGFCPLSIASSKTFGYISRYRMSKGFTDYITQLRNKAFYSYLEKPFKRSSINPAIGDLYIANNDDPLSVKSVVYNGKAHSLPRRYLGSIGMLQAKENQQEEYQRLRDLGIEDIGKRARLLYDELESRTKILKRGGV